MTTYETKLTKSVLPGEDCIFVDDADGWVAGDEVGIPATRLDFLENDYAIITEVVADATYNYKIVLDRQLTYHHFGSTQ